MSGDVKSTLLERFGPFTDKGGRGEMFVFSLGGRDFADTFSGLQDFGEVSRRGDRVILKLSQQYRQVERKVTRNARAIDRADKQVKRLRRDVVAVSAKLRQSRLQRKQGIMARSFGVTDDGTIKAGPLMLGRAGPTLNRQMIRGAFGHAFTAAMVSHVVAGIGNRAMDLRDDIQAARARGETATTMYNRAGKRVIGGAVEGFANTFGLSSLAKMSMRAAGASEAEADSALSELFFRMSHTAAEVRERDTNRRIAVETAAREVRETYEKAWDKISTHVPDSFVLKGKREQKMYRRDMRRLNHRVHDHARRAAEKKARDEARIAAMGGI